MSDPTQDAWVIGIAVLTTMFFVVLPVFVIFMLREKIPWWPGRVRRKIKFYEGEVKQFNVNDFNGKPMKNPDGSEIIEERMQYDNLELDTECWKTKRKGISCLYVQKDLLRDGFYLDIKYLAYTVPLEKNVEGKVVSDGNCIRVAHLTKGVWQDGAFAPIGSPDITMLDNRTLVFSEKIDPKRLNQSITTLLKNGIDDFKLEKNRLAKNSMIELLTAAAPAIAVVMVVLVALLSYNYLNSSQQNATDVYISALNSACGRAPAPNVTTAQPSGVQQIGIPGMAHG